MYRMFGMGQRATSFAEEVYVGVHGRYGLRVVCSITNCRGRVKHDPRGNIDEGGVS